MAPARFTESLSRLWRSCNSRFKNPHKPDPRHEFGALGERKARRLLRKAGYKILKTNFQPALYKKAGGQIDIVARQGYTLVFVEVKARDSSGIETASQAISRDQACRIYQGALSWLEMLGNPDIHFRFDVVEIYRHSPPGSPEGNIICNALDLSDDLIYSPETPSPFEQRSRLRFW